jgi:hypothetical protein
MRNFNNGLRPLKTILAALVLLIAASFSATPVKAQVKIGSDPTTIHPSAAFQIDATSGGLLIPRMTRQQMLTISNPSDGLMVNCTNCSPRGLYFVDRPNVNIGATWKLVGSNLFTDPIYAPGTLNCSGALSGTYSMGGIMGTGNTKVINVDVNQAGSYIALTNTQNGVQFLGQGVANVGTAVPLTLTASGTALTSGTFTYSINIGGQSCTFNVTFTGPAAFNCSGLIYTGTPTTLVNGQSYSGTVSVPYTAGNGTAYGATTRSGAGLTLTRVAGTFAAGGGNVVYNLSGTYTGTASYISIITAEGCATTLGNCAPFTVTHTAGTTAPVNKTVTYETVLTDLTGSSKCWIARNLGASQQATSATDNTEASAGWYWQFNRSQGFRHTGSARTPNTAWIGTINENSNWLITNDPCNILLGTGWRLPTSTELSNLDVNAGLNSIQDAYNTPLKLNATGIITNGNFGYPRGVDGFYWSSVQYSNTLGENIEFINTLGSNGLSTTGKNLAGTLRCLFD